MSKINGLLGKFKIKRDETHMTSESKPSTSLNAENCIKSSQEIHTSLKYCRFERTLNEVLNDPIALTYFINFMENIERLNLIKFWLHIKSFRLSLSKSDAENIFNNYLNDTTTLGIDILADIINKIRDNIFCEHNDRLKVDLFDEVHCIIWKLMETRYLKKFLYSTFYLKYQLEIYETKQLHLADVLRSHQLLSAFVEFLEENKQRNLLEFIIAVDSFIIELENRECRGKTRPPLNHQEDAMLIYDKFISMQATESIGIGDDVRIAVESGICTENGIPLKDVFDIARQITLFKLEKECMPSFLESNNFMQIVEEFKRNADSFIRMNDYSNDTFKHHRRSNSSLPSTSSSTSTCFENGDEIHRKRFSQFRNRSQTTDSGDDASLCDFTAICDEQSKAKRKQKCSSLAKIDKYGRYKPLFDNTLINDEESGQLSSRNRLKNTLDKYLNQTAMKENAAADEIAELIINEIQSMVFAAKHK